MQPTQHSQPSSSHQTIQLQPADHTTMPAYVALPARPNGAAVMVLQEAFGVTAHIRGVADRLAARGYLAIAPELFHRTAPAGYEGPYHNFSAVMPHYQAIAQDSLEADLRATYEWLLAHDLVHGQAVGCIGFCMGGRATFLANAVLPLKAAVSAYGGGIAPELLPLAAKQSGPLALLWGGKDAHIGADQRQAVAAALSEAGKPFVETLFAAADHGFFCPDRPSYHAVSAHQGWALVEAFFADHLAEATLRPRAGAEHSPDKAMTADI